MDQTRATNTIAAIQQKKNKKKNVAIVALAG